MRCFRHKAQIIIQGLPLGPEGDVETQKYQHYFARLFQSRPEQTSQERFEMPYYDYLQAPLQPLQENLESQTYETFEKDPVKYVRYEDAILRCLHKKLKDGKKSMVVMVVGAGRGPLVVAVRSAAAKAKADVRVWAVEKN